MPDNAVLNESMDDIELGFVEREATPQPLMKLSIQLHLAGLSLSNTVSILELFGVDRVKSTVHNWVHKADLQPDDGHSPDHVAVDETVIQLDGERYWLYAAVDPNTNKYLHVRLFPTRTTERTLLFLRELREKQQVSQATFLVEDAHHLKAALARLGLRFQVRRHGNRNAVERILREVKRRTSSFSNTFSHVEPATAESWIQAFAVWWNRC